MAKRLDFINNYQATAASGVDGFADYIEVDVVPDLGIGDQAAGSYFFPITCIDESGSVINTVATGWQSSPPRLFINTMYNNGLAGSCTILCAPNREVMQCLQSAQHVNDTVASGTYSAEHGITHWLNIAGACTLEVVFVMPDGDPWGNYTDIRYGAHITRFILTDTDADQPAITWAASYGDIFWADADDPQFSAGRTQLVVELVGTGGLLFGRYWAYA